MKFNIIFLLILMYVSANDVIIVGGGLSGLTTGYRLLKEGLNVTIYEGDKELGGRTRSIWYNETGISVGGTWSMFENTETMDLSQEFGIVPDIELSTQKTLNIQRIIKSPVLLLKLWLIGYSISEDYQTNMPDLDYISVKSWLDEQEKEYGINAIKAVRDYLILLETMPRDLNISMLFATRLIYDRLKLVDEYNQIYTHGAYRWEGGTGVLVNALVDKIKEMGGKIFTNSQITKIVWDKNQIKVIINKTKEDQSKRVVISTSLLASKNIKYEPNISEQYFHLFNNIQIFDDPVYQLILIYSEPWWRNNCGILLPDPETESEEKGVWGSFFELTPKNMNVGVLRILIRTIHINGLNFEEIVESGIQYLEQHYDNPEIKPKIRNRLLKAKYYNWNDYNNTIPGVTYYYKPDGTLINYGKYLRQTIANKIYWGGAERAKKGLHWIEGAISRGNEIAIEILKEENRTTSLLVKDVGFLKKEYIYWLMKSLDIILSGWYKILFKIDRLIFWMTGST